MSGWLALWVRASHCVIVTCHYSCSRGHRSNWRPKVMRNNMSFEDAFSCHMTHRGHLWGHFHYIQPTENEDWTLSCHHYQRCVKSVYLKIRKGKNEQTLSFLDPEVKGYTPPRGGTRQGWSRFPSYLPICPTGVLEGGGLTNFRVTHVCQRPGRFTRDWHLGCRSSCEVKAFLHLRQTEWSLPLASVLVWKTLMSNRD